MARDFEDSLIEALQDHVGDDGVVMRRRQEFRSRGGKFQGDQFVDIMVDSPKPEFYLGIEAKKGNASSSSKFYFSNHYPRDQVRSQAEYGSRSGREVFTAVDVRDYEGNEEQEGGDYLLFFPVEYFLKVVESDEAGIEWETLIRDGIDWTDGFTSETLRAARELREAIE